MLIAGVALGSADVHLCPALAAELSTQSSVECRFSESDGLIGGVVAVHGRRSTVLVVIALVFAAGEVLLGLRVGSSLDGFPPDHLHTRPLR